MNKIICVFAIIVSLSLAQSPIVGAIMPSMGLQGGTVSAIVSGANFVATPTVFLGSDITTTGVTYLTSSLLQVNLSISPVATLGPHDVIVTNPSGLADTLIGGFTVLPETLAPSVSLIFPPLCNMFISCRDTFIMLRLDDENGIDEASFVMRVDGVDYTVSDPEIAILFDSLAFFIPTPWFTDGDTVDFAVVRVADTFGNTATMPISCRFIVDTLPPQVPMTGTEPPMYSSTRDLTPAVLIPVLDVGSGINTAAFSFTVITPDDETLFYHFGDPSLRWFRDTLIWEASVAGLTFETDETVWVCLHAEDLVPDVGCGNNVLDTCWYFFFMVPPPLLMDLFIHRIYTNMFPLVQAMCLVYDEDNRTIEGLDEKNFQVWEDYGDGWVEQYPLIVEPLGAGGLVDIVFVVDTTGSMWGMIDDVVAGGAEFAESRARAGISYRLGLVEFSDYVEFYHGYDLIADVSVFRTWVLGMSAGGGGDWAEVSLDGIYDALDSMHFRPGAQIVIIMVTDAPYHYLGDGTVYSDVTLDMVLTNLYDHRAMLFVVSSYYVEDYAMLCDSTGGRFFSWSGSGDFRLILPLIVESVQDGYLVSWTSGHPVADCHEDWTGGIEHVSQRRNR